MQFRRRTRIILFAVGVPLLLILLLLLFLKLYFTSDRLKALIVPKIQASLNREVSVNEIGLSLFPRFGVKMGGLSIANRKGSGFSEQPLVYLDGFLLEVKLLPLLANRVEMNRLTVTRPKILLEINQDGEENYSNPDQNAKGEAKEGTDVRSVTGGAYSLFVSRFDIKEGELVYINQKENRSIRMSGIDMSFRMESISELNELRTDSELRLARFSYGAIEKPLVDNLALNLKQQSKVLLQENSLRIEEGSLEIQGIKLQMNGSLTLVDQNPPLVDLSFDSDNLDLKQLLSLVPRGILQETENAEITGYGRLSAKIHGSLGKEKQPEIFVEGVLTDGSIRYPKLPRAITEVNLKARLVNRESGSRLEVTEGSFKLGENPVKLKLALDNLSDPLVDVNIQGVVNLSELKDFYPVEAGEDLTGLMRANVSVRGKSSTPTAMKGHGTIELQNVTFGTTEKPIRNLNGTLIFNNQFLETKRLTMDYAGSGLSLSFVLRDYLPLIFPAKSAPARGRTAKPSMSVHLSSNYFELPPSKEPIVLPPFDVDATIAISKFVFKGNTPFECTDLWANILSSERVLQMKNLYFRSLDGAMSVTGVFDLRTTGRPVFDLNVGIKDVDAHLFLRRFSSFGNHFFGKFSLSMMLKGELNDTLGINTKSLSGHGSVHVVDGKLTGYPVMQRLATFLDLPEMRDLSFRSWSNDFQIADGRIKIPDLIIAARDNDFLLSGWQGFDGSLDYSLTIRLSEKLSNRFSDKSIAAQVGGLFKDNEGRVTLFILVGGTTKDPTFHWDTNAAQEKLRRRVAAELERKKGEIRDKAKEELQKKIDEGKEKLKERLKKIFPKP